MTKVLHLIGNFEEDKGGAQRVIVDIINSCDDSNLELGVCTLFGKATLSKELSRDVYNVNFKHQCKYNAGIFIDLYRVIAGWQPDILHVHSSVAGIFGRPIAKISGVKIISSVHNDVRQISFRNKLLDKLTIGFSDAIVCVSDLAKESVLEEYSSYLSENDIYTVWNSLDCNKFKKDVKIGKQDKREELNLDDSKILIGTVGRLHPHKGQKFLLKAWQKVISEFPDAGLLVIGDGKEKKGLKQLAAELGITESVHFLGSRNDVPELLNTLDVFVFPSIYEGLGISLLEAMCMEKIIIASDIEPLKQVLENTGILVPPKDPKSLGEKIVEVLNNFEDHKYLGSKARKRVLKNFSPEEFGRKYIGVYNKVISK